MARSILNSSPATRMRRGSSSQAPGAAGRRPVRARRRGPAAGAGTSVARAFAEVSRPTSRPRCSATSTLPDGRARQDRVHTDCGALPRRCAMRRRRVADACGVPAETITRLAREMAHVAFTRDDRAAHRVDRHAWGRTHDSVVGRPVAMHAMRGVSAHSNGFQTCRALHLIQMLLGALDGPGNFRARAPYPRPIPPQQRCRRMIRVTARPTCR